MTLRKKQGLEPSQIPAGVPGATPSVPRPIKAEPWPWLLKDNRAREADTPSKSHGHWAGPVSVTGLKQKRGGYITAWHASYGAAKGAAPAGAPRIT